MVSPARAHFIRHRAAAEAKAAADNAGRPNATQFELHMAQLAEHRRALRKIQSVERKVAFKVTVLPEYADYVAGVLSEEPGTPDEVLATVMIWRIDAGDIDGALDIAGYVLRHNLPLPDQYKRDAATAVAEEIAERALATMATAGEAPVPETVVEQLVRTADLVRDHDMPDEVQAKLHKAIGYALRGHDPATALQELTRAVELNPKVGVKKDIERLERAIKNAQPGNTG